MNFISVSEASFILLFSQSSNTTFLMGQFRTFFVPRSHHVFMDKSLKILWMSLNY